MDPSVQSYRLSVVSASKERADAFSTFCQRLIWELEGLEYLKPRTEQRQSKISFDVGPATASQSPSVKSVGITSMVSNWLNLTAPAAPFLGLLKNLRLVYCTV